MKSLKEEYDSIQAKGETPYADMGKALIENLSIYGLGVQPKSDLEALFFHCMLIAH